MRTLAGIIALSSLLACNASGTHATGSSTSGPAGTVADAKGSWPAFRGADGTGISKETGINKAWASKAPKLVWQSPMTDDGYAGPSVANGLLYIVDHQGGDDVVHALNLSNGKEAWKYTYADASQSNYGFSRSTPTVDGDKLYVVSRLGKVICLGAKTGKVVWQVDMVADFGGQRPNWDYAGSPLVDGAKLIITPGANDGAVVALDKTTGKTIWKGSSGAPGYSTPVIATLGGKKQYVVFLANKLVGVDSGSGAELWSFPWETANGVNAAAPLVMGESVFIASGYGKGCAMVDIKGGQATARWQNRSIQAHFSSPIFYQGHIYGTGDPGVLVCLDPATGNTLWKQQGFEKGGLVAADGVMIVQNGSNGETVMVKLDPTSYQEMGRISPLKGQAWTSPIIVGKTLIVRNKEAIAAVDLS